MEKPKKAGIGKIIVIAVFCLLLMLPAALNVMSRVTNNYLDVPLGGYTATAQKPELSLSAWLEGTLQESVSGKIEEAIKPRGLMVRIYNTLNLLLFNKGKRIIGKNRDIFEPAYIQAELTLTDPDDFSLENNVRSMTAYVESLQQLNDKLKEHGKTLVFYLAASKASLHRENIPDKYFLLSPNHTRSVDVFREEIAKTDVPYLICGDYAEEIGYPAFYTTGIHWSRPYEQFVSRKVMETVREASGKNYNNIVLGGTLESKTPYGRDSDMLNLLNVFWKPDVTYYEYEMWLEDNEDAPRLRMLIHGDSFSDGLRKDLLRNDPEAEIVQVTRDVSIRETDGNEIELNHDFSVADWREYLDRADVVVIESGESGLKKYSYGFIQELLDALERTP